MTPKEFVKSWFENIDTGRFDQIEKMMDANHQFFNPMTPAPANKEQHLGMIKMTTKAFAGSKHHIDVLVSEGEWITARGRVIGKHTGEFNGVPATGKKVEFSWIDIMHVVNGKVREEYFELNPMTIMQQIGAVAS